MFGDEPTHQLKVSSMKDYENENRKNSKQVNFCALFTVTFTFSMLGRQFQHLLIATISYL